MKYIFAMYIILFIIFTPMLYAEEYSHSKTPETLLLKDKSTKPEPYNINEFEDWMYYVFRFLAVSVGSFPFSIMISTIVFDTYRTIIESQNAGYFKSEYLPFLKGPNVPPYTSNEVSTILLTAFGISLTVGVVDFIIAIVKDIQKKSIKDLFKEEFTRNTY